MNKEIVQQIINDVYPEIVNHYGAHDIYEIPTVEVHTNIFARISGIEGMEGDSCPSGEFCKDENGVVQWDNNCPNLKVDEEGDFIEPEPVEEVKEEEQERSNSLDNNLDSDGD